MGTFIVLSDFLPALLFQMGTFIVLSDFLPALLFQMETWAWHLPETPNHHVLAR